MMIHIILGLALTIIIASSSPHETGVSAKGQEPRYILANSIKKRSVRGSSPNELNSSHDDSVDHEKRVRRLRRVQSSPTDQKGKLNVKQKTTNSDDETLEMADTRAGDLADFAAGLGNALGGAFAGNPVNDLGSTLGNTLGGAVNDFLNNVPNGGPPLGGNVSNSNPLGGLAGDLGDTLGGVVDGVNDSLGDAVDGALGGVNDVLGGVNDALNGALGGGNSTTGNLGENLSGLASDLASGIGGAVGGALGGDVGSNIGSNLANGLGNAGNAVGGAIGSAVDGVLGNGNGNQTNLGSIVGNVGNAIGGAVGGALGGEAGANLGANLGNTLGNVIGVVGGALQNSSVIGTPFATNETQYVNLGNGSLEGISGVLSLPQVSINGLSNAGGSSEVVYIPNLKEDNLQRVDTIPPLGDLPFGSNGNGNSGLPSDQREDPNHPGNSTTVVNMSSINSTANAALEGNNSNASDSLNTSELGNGVHQHNKNASSLSQSGNETNDLPSATQKHEPTSAPTLAANTAAQVPTVAPTSVKTAINLGPLELPKVPTINITIYNIRSSLRNVGPLTDEDITKWERLMEEWFMDYFQKKQDQQRRYWQRQIRHYNVRRLEQQHQRQREARPIATDVQFVDQSVAYDTDGVPTNTITYDQQLFYEESPTSTSSVESNSSQTTAIATTPAEESNNNNDTILDRDALESTSKEIASLPFQDFTANTDLALNLRTNIPSLENIEIPLPVPQVQPQTAKSAKDDKMKLSEILIIGGVVLVMVLLMMVVFVKIYRSKRVVNESDSKYR